jgi:hypothetical protein
VERRQGVAMPKSIWLLLLLLFGGLVAPAKAADEP